MGRIAEDPRIDPRIKALMDAFPDIGQADVASREEILEEASRPEAVTLQEQTRAMLEILDDETVAPSAGLDISTLEITSEPDGNAVKIQFIRPQGDGRVPCVYYIHGGGMQSMSCFDGMYRSWGRIIAAQGVAVAMVDFRNCVTPSSAPEVAPFPAGLNDCVSGLKWVHAHADELGIDPDHIIVAGESGGGNLTLATGLKLKQDGDLGLIRGLYAHVPLHRRVVAAGAVPVLDREQRPAARPAQQPGRDGLRHRGVRGGQPAGLAVVRHRGRRARPACRPSSASTSATPCATRASPSTACCCGPACRPAAVR